MLEKRKEEGEAVGKYTQFLTTFVIGAFILFMAPYIVAFVTDDTVSDSGIFAPPEGVDIAPEITDKVDDLFQFVMWIARIIVVLGVIMFVILLYVNPEPRSAALANSRTDHPAALA